MKKKKNNCPSWKQTCREFQVECCSTLVFACSQQHPFLPSFRISSPLISRLSRLRWYCWFSLLSTLGRGLSVFTTRECCQQCAITRPSSPSQGFPCRTWKHSEELAVTHRRKCIRGGLIPATMPKTESLTLSLGARGQLLAPQRAVPVIAVCCDKCIWPCTSLNVWSKVPWNCLQQSEDSWSHLEVTRCLICSMKSWVILCPRNQHHQIQRNHSVGQTQWDKEYTMLQGTKEY